MRDGASQAQSASAQLSAAAALADRPRRRPSRPGRKRLPLPVANPASVPQGEPAYGSTVTSISYGPSWVNRVETT